MPIWWSRCRLDLWHSFEIISGQITSCFFVNNLFKKQDQRCGWYHRVHFVNKNSTICILPSFAHYLNLKSCDMMSHFYQGLLQSPSICSDAFRRAIKVFRVFLWRSLFKSYSRKIKVIQEKRYGFSDRWRNLRVQQMIWNPKTWNYRLRLVTRNRLVFSRDALPKLGVVWLVGPTIPPLDVS